MKRTMVIAASLMLFLSGCQMRITPEDAAKANDIAGNTSDIEIITPDDEEYDEAGTGAYLTVTAGLDEDFDFYETANLFTGYDDETIENNSFISTWEFDGIEEWGQVLNTETGTFMTNGSNGRVVSLSYVQNTDENNIYKSLINTGRESGTAYNLFFLRERFPNSELEDYSSDEVLEDVKIYLESVGYEYRNVDIYAMDKESLLAIQDEEGIYSPDGDAWDEDDECYLLRFEAVIEDYEVFDISNITCLSIIYSKEKGLMYFELPVLYGEISAEEETELIAPSEIFQNLSGMAADLNIEGTKLEVAEVQSGYVAKRQQQFEDDTKGYLTPCYRILYQVTKADGTVVPGEFIVDAVTGERVSWD